MVLRLYNMLVKIWMNQKHLEKQVGIANISVKAQYYSSELNKNEMRKTRVWNLSIP